MRTFVYSFLIVILGIVFYFGSFVGPKHGVASAIGGFIFGAPSAASESGELEKLRQENQALKAQLMMSDLTGNKIKVFSTYPFNNPTEIAISAGSKRGIKTGDVVTVGRTLYVGRVSQVFKDYSIVSTIFDADAKIEARVGEKEADALFTGGNTPGLNLISRNAGIAVGDAVFTAQKGMPYGLQIGKVKQVIDVLGDPVKKAVVEPAVELRDIRDVEVRS